MYCQLLRPQLEAVLAEQPPANRIFFDLLGIVHQLELHALQWHPSVLGGGLTLPVPSFSLVPPCFDLTPGSLLQTGRPLCFRVLPHWC